MVTMQLEGKLVGKLERENLNTVCIHCNDPDSYSVCVNVRSEEEKKKSIDRLHTHTGVYTVHTQRVNKSQCGR